MYHTPVHKQEYKDEVHDMHNPEKVESVYGASHLFHRIAYMLALAPSYVFLILP